MRKRYSIQVRNQDGSIVETIERVLRSEMCGNFCPAFCTYQSRKCLVMSDSLHFDDPFRSREEDHVDSLYILPRGKDGFVVATWDKNKTRKET